MRSSLFALIVALVALSLFVSDTTPGVRASGLRGDVNCSGAVDGTDALDILLEIVGQDVEVQPPCLPIGKPTVDGFNGDVNCDNEFDLLDTLIVLELFSELGAGPCLAVALASTGAVADTVGPDGGTLATTSLDGTTFTLEIPPGALAGAQLIEMRPVESIDALPISNGLVAAVDLQPSGLRFFAPSILTIDPATPIPVDQQVAFMINDGEFVLHPLVLDSAEIQLPLLHFSTPGLGNGDPTPAPKPSAPEDAFTGQMAELMNAERAAQLLGFEGDPEFDQKATALMSEYFHQRIFPLLLRAESDCQTAQAVIPEALAWARMMLLTGANGSFEIEVEAVLESVAPAFRNCREEAFDRCVDEHDLGAISEIISYTRALILVGDEDENDPTMQEMLDKCARFELDFESWFCIDDMSANCETGIDVSFRAMDVLFANVILPSENPLGGGTLEMFRNEWGPGGLPPYTCEGPGSSPGAQFVIEGGGVAPNVVIGQGPRGAAVINLVINPGRPIESWTLTCQTPLGQTTETEEHTYWWEKWCSWHYEELVPGFDDSIDPCYDVDVTDSLPFNITDWQYNGGELYARKIYDRAYTEVGSLEQGFEITTIELWHRPEP